MQAPVNKVRRSRFGCRECRRLHQRCDESRPACKYCCLAGKECSYNVQLSWGGRRFEKSRFGKYLNQGAVLVHNSSDLNRKPQFIYGTAGVAEACTQTLKSSMAIGFPRIESQLPRRVNFLTHTARIRQNPNWLSSLPPRYHLLLDHFIVTVTNSYSLHQILRKDLCSKYIPVALAASHGAPVLAAMLSIAVTHRASLGVNESEVELAQLRHVGLAHLRLQLSGHQNPPDHISAATALILCLGEILSGGIEPDARLLHLRGAAAILRRTYHGHDTDQSRAHDGTRLILWRFWKALEILAFQCGESSMPSDLYFVSDIARGDTGEHIDEFIGHSTKLIPILAETDLLALEKRGVEASHHQTQHQKLDNMHRTDRIRSSGYKMIEQILSLISEPTRSFPSSLDNGLSAVVREDISLLDEAYHHVALIQVYRTVLCLPAEYSNVQISVQRILSCLSRIDLQRQSCPGMALLQPMFIAGCNASIEEDRAAIIDWMQRMEIFYAMSNIPPTRAYLRELWKGNEKAWR